MCAHIVHCARIVSIPTSIVTKSLKLAIQELVAAILCHSASIFIIVLWVWPVIPLSNENIQDSQLYISFIFNNGISYLVFSLKLETNNRLTYKE